MLHCKACETPVSLEPGEVYNRDSTHLGIFCDVCWRWQKQIDTLMVRVEKLEVRGVAVIGDRAYLNQ